MAMDWKALPGQTLLVPSWPAGEHLFVLIGGAVEIPNRGVLPHVALVSFTTLRPAIPHDDACVVQAGEHPFIRHLSYAYYRGTRIEPVAHVISMVQSAAWKPHVPCNQQLLERLQRGVCASRLVSREVKQLFDCA